MDAEWVLNGCSMDARNDVSPSLCQENTDLHPLVAEVFDEEVEAGGTDVARHAIAHIGGVHEVDILVGQDDVRQVGIFMTAITHRRLHFEMIVIERKLPFYRHIRGSEVLLGLLFDITWELPIGKHQKYSRYDINHPGLEVFKYLEIIQHCHNDRRCQYRSQDAVELELRLAKIDGMVVTQIEFLRQLGREMILRTWIHNSIDLFGFIDK